MSTLLRTIIPDAVERQINPEETEMYDALGYGKYIYGRGKRHTKRKDLLQK